MGKASARRHSGIASKPHWNNSQRLVVKLRTARHRRCHRWGILRACPDVIRRSVNTEARSCLGVYLPRSLLKYRRQRKYRTPRGDDSGTGSLAIVPDLHREGEFAALRCIPFSPGTIASGEQLANFFCSAVIANPLEDRAPIGADVRRLRQGLHDNGRRRRRAAKTADVIGATMCAELGGEKQYQHSLYSGLMDATTTAAIRVSMLSC